MARQNPALYATYVEELRRHSDGHDLVVPGEPKWRLKEGIAALDEAARFLHTVHPQQPLILSSGMSHAAADHCADQAAGRTGHRGSDRSTSSSRLSRYGVWTGEWGEDIAYGKTNARQIVLALIIDDGQPTRLHRKNIFDSNFNYAGAACGPHRRYGMVCTVNFAARYVERANEPAGAAVK